VGYHFRLYHLAADRLPITPISYHPPADNTILFEQVTWYAAEALGNIAKAITRGEPPAPAAPVDPGESSSFLLYYSQAQS